MSKPDKESKLPCWFIWGCAKMSPGEGGKSFAFLGRTNMKLRNMVFAFYVAGKKMKC